MTYALANLGTGFAAAASLQNIGFALLGCLLGTLIGVLPGIGPIPTIAMLLPLTFGLDPLSALIMLAGIYYGAQYGGSTSSILVNMPGEASSVVTCMDGHQMARQGRAGSALAVAALGSFFAGCVGTFFIAAFGPALADVSQKFNSPEYFSLMSELWDGIDFLPMVIGIFGIVEIIRNLEEPDLPRTSVSTKLRDLWPTFKDFQQSWKPALRGTGIGAILGILPGGGAVLASFASYTMEKRIAKDPSRFGKGPICFGAWLPACGSAM